MGYSIVLNGPGSTAGLPVAVVDQSTGETLALYKSVIDATVHVRLLESDAVGRSEDDQIDIGDLVDPDEDDPDASDDDDDADKYCPLCGDDDHGEDDCPGPDDDRAVRRLDAALIRLGAPPREWRPYR